MRSRHIARFVAFALSVIAPGFVGNAQVGPFKPVTDEMLLRPDPGDYSCICVAQPSVTLGSLTRRDPRG
jgi:hypothetical protein